MKRHLSLEKKKSPQGRALSPEIPITTLQQSKEPMYTHIPFNNGVIECDALDGRAEASFEVE